MDGLDWWTANIFPLFQIVLAQFDPFASWVISSRDFFLTSCCKFEVTDIKQVNGILE